MPSTKTNSSTSASPRRDGKNSNSSASDRAERDGQKSTSQKNPKPPNSPNSKSDSPNNSRPIPENTKLQKWFLFVSIIAGFLTLIFLLASVLVGLDIYQHKQEVEQKMAQRKHIEEEIVFWQDVTRRYKGFRDAYLKLASLEYQLGNKEKVNMYVNEALKIDPNAKEALQMNKILK